MYAAVFSGESESQTPEQAQIRTCVKEIDDEGNPSNGILGELSRIIPEECGPIAGKGSVICLVLSLSAARTGKLHAIMRK